MARDDVVDDPADQVGNARLYCERLAEWLAEQGVVFRFSEQVTGFDIQGEAVSVVQAAGGAQSADAVVLAAGSFSTELARQLKLRLRVAPSRG